MLQITALVRGIRGNNSSNNTLAPPVTPAPVPLGTHQHLDPCPALTTQLEEILWMFEWFFILFSAESAGGKTAFVFQNYTDLVPGPGSCRGPVDSGEPAR